MSGGYAALQPPSSSITITHSNSSNDDHELTPSSHDEDDEDDDDDESPLDKSDFDRTFELQVLSDPQDDYRRSIDATTGQEGEGEGEDKSEDEAIVGLPLRVGPRRRFTPDEERRLVRKLDWRLVAFMAFLYLLSFIDRSNIGNAKIAGLSADLDLSDSQWQWLLEGFYITYILFQWMIMLYNVVPPHVYISLCVLSWGLTASFQSLATSFPQMLVLRLLLGVGEAAFSPGIPYYLSFFYRREELAFRTGLMISAAPLASSFAGSLAWLITWLGQNGPFAPWRLLFLFEGFPSVFTALIAWNVVPDSPQTAGFLSNHERKIATRRLRDDSATTQAAPTGGNSGARTHSRGLDWAEIGTTLRDPKCYLTAVMFFMCNVAFSSMPVFLPTIINEMGYSTLTSQALSAPPYLVSFIVVLLTARLSDRLKSRGALIALHALLASAGYAFIAIGGIFHWPHLLRYLGVYPAAAGFFSAVTLIITWTINNQEGNSAKGVGMTILNIVGQLGPILGTRLYPETDKPYYVVGMSVCAGAMLLVFFMASMMRGLLKKENRRRLQLEAAGSDSRADMGLLPGEKTEQFLYII